VFAGSAMTQAFPRGSQVCVSKDQTGLLPPAHCQPLEPPLLQGEGGAASQACTAPAPADLTQKG
jgi:hypothetical protein